MTLQLSTLCHKASSVELAALYNTASDGHTSPRMKYDFLFFI